MSPRRLPVLPLSFMLITGCHQKPAVPIQTSSLAFVGCYSLTSQPWVGDHSIDSFFVLPTTLTLDSTTVPTGGHVPSTFLRYASPDLVKGAGAWGPPTWSAYRDTIYVTWQIGADGGIAIPLVRPDSIIQSVARIGINGQHVSRADVLLGRSPCGGEGDTVLPN